MLSVCVMFPEYYGWMWIHQNMIMIQYACCMACRPRAVAMHPCHKRHFADASWWRPLLYHVASRALSTIGITSSKQQVQLMTHAGVDADSLSFCSRYLSRKFAYDLARHRDGM